MSDPAPIPTKRRPINTAWTLIVLAFFAPLVFSALKQARMSNDIQTWLPAEDAGAKILRWSQEHFEPEERFLLSWDSSSLADPRVLALAEQLRGDPQKGEQAVGIKTVITPHEVLSGMVEHQVENDEAVQRLTGVLVGTGLMKIRLTDAGRQQRREVERRLIAFADEELEVEADIAPPVSVPEPKELPPAVAVLGSKDEAALSPDEEIDEQTSEYRLSDWSVPPHDFQVRWRGINPDAAEAERLREFALSLRNHGKPLVEDAYFASGAPVALSVSLTPDGSRHVSEVVEGVKQAAESVGIPREELRMGGSPIGAEELNRASARSAWNPDYSWAQFHKRSPLALSAIVGTLLAFLLLRSVRLAILVLITSVYTAVAVVALVPATGQTLNTVLIVMPNLLLVLTMSGAIHLANYWKHASHAGVRDPISMAVRMAFEPCTLAAVTTAIGLASLLTSVLTPVKQFGVYSAIGCLFSLAMVLLAFPALLRVWPGRASKLTDPHQDIWHRLGLALARHGTPVTLACLALFVLSAVGLRWFRTETKVIRYFPDSARIVQDYEFLEDNLAGIVSVDAIVRFRAPQADEENGEREETAAASNASDLDLFQRIELVRALQRQIETVPGITGTLSLADFRNESEGRPERVTISYLRNLRFAERRIFEQREESTREFVTHAETPLSVELDGVPFRVEPGEEVWRIRAQSSAITERHYGDLLADIDAALKSELAGRPGIDHVVSGMVPLFLRTQEAVLESLIRSFGLAFVVIAAVMMFLLRSVIGGVLTMLPNILPVSLVFGAISWAEIPVDIGTMITASVALGIAVDGTLHLLTWFRDGIRRGMSREEAIAQALGHCAPAMWQTSAAIAVALLMLAFADLLLISRFGWLMSALIAAALVADVIYLPALLSGALGSVIENTVRRRSARPGAAEEKIGEPVPETVPSDSGVEQF
jgi:predicted RND superfamily exporter protein